MIKKITLLLLFVMVSSTVVYSTVVTYADDNSGKAITIDDIREKRGSGTPIGTVDKSTVIDKAKAVILTQPIQFLINIVVILVIILILIYIKHKSNNSSSAGEVSKDKIIVNVEGEINSKKLQPIEKPALLEIIEKLFFPFFRRDIANINTHLNLLTAKLDEIQQISDRQIQKSNELISHYHSIVLNEIKLRTDKISTAIDSDMVLPYRLFTLGKSLQITKEINYSYEAFVKSAELSLSIEREFNLFTQIPLEYFAKKITDKNIVAIGNWANLLTKYLGYGVSFKHSFLDAIEVSSSGEKIIPLSLISNHIEKIESMIITNEQLSTLILYSDNILEVAKDKISESIIMPIEISVPQFELEFIKFGGVERNQHGVYKWAVGFEDISGIKIYNNSHRATRVEVRFSVVATTEGSSIIINNEKVLIENNIEIVRTIELADGENFLSFDFEGQKIKIGADPRELKFAIYNFSFNGNIVMNDITIATEDYNIRKRLHSVGFFEVEAEIVTNKGFYIEKLPTSKFLYSKDLHTVTDSAQFFRKYVSSSKINILTALYKGYRNEKSKD